MADKTEIEWADASWNPIVGCSVVSPGCTNCYAMRQADRVRRMNGDGSHYFGTTKIVNEKPVWTGKVALAPGSVFLAPLRWKRPRAIFVNSMGDLFHESVPDAWIYRVFAVMAFCANTRTDENNVICGYFERHTFPTLTKRSRRMREYVSALKAGAATLNDVLAHPFSEACRQVSKLAGHPFWMNAPFTGWGWIDAGMPGFVAGASVERQQEADERLPDLLATPADTRIVSIEPMLGPVDLDFIRWVGGARYSALYGWSGPNADLPCLDGVILGGESGPHARPMHPDWPRAVRDQCAEAGVKFFFKQWGEWAPALDPDGVVRTEGHGSKGAAWLDGRWEIFERGDRHGDVFRLGKKRAGRLLDGREHNDLPWEVAHG